MKKIFVEANASKFRYFRLSALLWTMIFISLASPPRKSWSEESPKSSSESIPADLPAELAGNEAVREHMRQFRGRGAVTIDSVPSKTPDESREAFKLPDDLRMDTVLHEPEVLQPVCINFDHRGRMWVVQYLQYPFPAGLKVVKYDEHLRAVFDKVPPAPPHHDRGRDKITIHEDTTGDGQYDTYKTFVDGLNIVTSALPGRGGVWVMNPPYLMFYRDADGDDIPDGDPEVHLAGFGLEDTHAVANSLAWGPDGWLYGAQGSTCWANVTLPGSDDPPVHFKGQGIWRYHPSDKKFEIFAEGGGNTFCVEFDAQGRLFSGHNGGNTRGFHYVQGGYYSKAWGKHGELTNPHAYGYFNAIPHAKVERFSHTLVKYEAALLPKKYQGKLFAPVPLHNYVALSAMTADGSSWKTEDLEPVVKTDDQWFRPVDIKTGPDGAVYIADWYDTRLTHVDPRDTWDRTKGRIWRIRGSEPITTEPLDISQQTNSQLAETLESPSKWYRQQVLRILADRAHTGRIDSGATTFWQAKFRESGNGQTALEYLWATHHAGGLDDATAKFALNHSDPQVRLWTARLLGDRREVSADIAAELARLAAEDRSPEVLVQLAATAKRIPSSDAVSILENLTQRDEHAGDPFLPLMVWWGIEAHADEALGALVERLSSSIAWSRTMNRQVALPRLARRMAAVGGETHLMHLATLLRSAPTPQDRSNLLASMQQGWEGKRFGELPQPLLEAIAAAANNLPAGSIQRLTLLTVIGDQEAIEESIRFVSDPKRNQTQRVNLIRLLAQLAPVKSQELLLEIATSDQAMPLRQEALSGLRYGQDKAIGQRLVADYTKLSSDQRLKQTTLEVLSARRPWAGQLLAAIEAEKVPRSDLPLETVEAMKLHRDDDLTAQIEKIWGSTRASSGEIQSQMLQVASILQTGKGNPAAGKLLFNETCAKCHKLFNEGKEIGPDLTGYERTNLDFMLLATIDPSAAIREEYTTFQVLTVDGLILTGFIRERGQNTLTMENADRGKITIPLDDIEEGPIAIPQSLMPDRLLDAMTAQQIRDLFAYLQRAE